MDLAEWKELTRRANGAAARGRTKEARQLLQIALTFAERTQNATVLGTTLNNLAVLASQNGHCDIAEHLFERARNLPLAPGEPSGLMAYLDTNSAVNYHRQGKVIEARPFYREAVRDTYAPHRFADRWAAALSSFSLLQLEQGRLPQAESLAKRARMALERFPARDHKIDGHVKYAGAQQTLAAGRLPKAETEFSELISNEAVDPVLTALAQVGLAKVYDQQYLKLAEFDSPNEAKQKLAWADSLFCEALATLIEFRGAASLEYVEAALGYVEHLSMCCKWTEAELWAQRLLPWVERLGGGYHPWIFRLMELQERNLRQQQRITDAEEVAQKTVELRFRAKAASQGDEREDDG